MHRLSAFDISIHAPREGRDFIPDGGFSPTKISIHAPREGRDCSAAQWACSHPIFQSTRPARGATPRRHRKLRRAEISIHAPREGRDLKNVGSQLSMEISIHAPREGRDEWLD